MTTVSETNILVISCVAVKSSWVAS